MPTTSTATSTDPGAPPDPPTTDSPTGTEAALEVLRRRPAATELLGGFGPLALAAALLVAMVLLAPSVAPERIVEREVAPADDATATTTTTTEVER